MRILILLFFFIMLSSMQFDRALETQKKISECDSTAYSLFLIDENEYKLSNDVGVDAMDIYIISNNTSVKDLKKFCASIAKLYETDTKRRKEFKKKYPYKVYNQLDALLNQLGVPRIAYKYGCVQGMKSFKQLATGDTIQVIQINKKEKEDESNYTYTLLKHRW